MGSSTLIQHSVFKQPIEQYLRARGWRKVQHPALGRGWRHSHYTATPVSAGVALYLMMGGTGDQSGTGRALPERAGIAE